MTVTCANQTAQNVSVPPLFSKLSVSLFFQKDASPHDHKEKVTKTKERKENTEVTAF